MNLGVDRRVATHERRNRRASRPGLSVEPLAHPREMPALVIEHATQRRPNGGMRPGPMQMPDEVPIDAALEHLREYQHLEQ